MRILKSKKTPKVEGSADPEAHADRFEFEVLELNHDGSLKSGQLKSRKDRVESRRADSDTTLDTTLKTNKDRSLNRAPNKGDETESDSLFEETSNDLKGDEFSLKTEREYKPKKTQRRHDGASFGAAKNRAYRKGSEGKWKNTKASYQDIHSRAIYLLSMREHSTAELSSKLAQKFDKSELVPSVIEQVTEDGYLSDERFTEAYVRMRQGRGFGPVKIRSELMNRSVSNTLIDEYLDQRAALWLNIAEDQYLKKFGQTKVKDYKDWSRRARFLQSRGFNRDHIDLTVPRETKDYLD